MESAALFVCLIGVAAFLFIYLIDTRFKRYQDSKDEAGRARIDARSKMTIIGSQVVLFSIFILSLIAFG